MGVSDLRVNNLRIVAVGICAVAVLDSAGAFASRALEFPYASLSIVSAAIYFAIGFFAYRTRYWDAVTATFWVSLFDVTVGWYISAVIGPGRIPGSRLPGAFVAGCSASFVVLLSIGIALVGGFARSRRLASRSTTPN